MFNPRFMEELFKPQEIYNKAALKALFHDLAHASIMRLNETSMNKLYDLMTMVFKWQVFSASHPRELILITLNHLDSMRALVSCSSILKQLDTAYFMFIKVRTWYILKIFIKLFSYIYIYILLLEFNIRL